MIEAIERPPQVAPDRHRDATARTVTVRMVPPERPFYSRWSTWLLAGVAVGGVVALPLRLQANADGDEDSALRADIALGVVVGFGVVAAVLGIRDLVADPKPQMVEAGLAPTDGGATATVKVRF